MSLYTPASLIRKMILEAEDLTLNPNSRAQQTEQFTDAASPNDVMADMTAASAIPPASAPGLQGSALTMPQAPKPQTTVSKTVINRDIILSQLAELKSVITNYEKKFDGDDLTPEDANVYISSLLSTLVFHAERFNTFMESDKNGSEPDISVPEEPLAEPAPASTLPEPMPEVPAETETGVSGLQEPGAEAPPQV